MPYYAIYLCIHSIPLDISVYYVILEITRGGILFSLGLVHLLEIAKLNQIPA